MDEDEEVEAGDAVESGADAVADTDRSVPAVEAGDDLLCRVSHIHS